LNYTRNLSAIIAMWFTHVKLVKTTIKNHIK